VWIADFRQGILRLLKHNTMAQTIDFEQVITKEFKDFPK
jgi:hypothetical protein